jgi:hypothetical protein
MSQLTLLNRWKRYQIARLQGLIGGLREEAGRLRSQDFTPAIDALGEAMMAELLAQCDALKNGVKNGENTKLPELELERL